MASPEISSHELLQRLQKEPDNEELISEVATRINDPAHQYEIGQAAYAVMKKQPSWSNCIGQHKCSLKKLLQPTSRNDLVNAVGAGISEGLHVRVVGSGHSFSNVCFPYPVMTCGDIMKASKDMRVWFQHQSISR